MHTLSARSTGTLRAAAATLTLLGLLALLITRWSNGADGLPPAIVEPSGLASDPRAGAPPTQPPLELIELPAAAATESRVAPTEDSVPAKSTEPSREGPSRDQVRKERMAHERAERGAEAPSYRRIIRPLIDSHRIQGFNSSHRIDLRASFQGRAASTSGFLTDPLTLELTTTESAQPPPVTLTVDHRAAMPTSVEIAPEDWGFDGQAFIATPRVVLAPMDGRLRLAKSAPRGVRPAGHRIAFEGRCALVTIESDGNLRVLDSFHYIERYRGRKSLLRFTAQPTGGLILGIPDAPFAAADLIDVSGLLSAPADPSKIIAVPTSLRGRRPLKHKFDILDPFNEPMEGCQILAYVDPNRIARHRDDGTPVAFDGFVFVHSSMNSAEVDGQRVLDDQVQAVPFALVRMTAAAESTASGRAVVEGIHAGIHLLTLTSPLGDTEPIENDWQAQSGPQVALAPLVGLVVQCPLAWRHGQAGKDAWARARVEITGEHRAHAFTTRDGQALQPRRFLVRPDQPVTVTCTASGYPTMTAEMAPRASSMVATVFPAEPMDGPNDVPGTGQGRW